MALKGIDVSHWNQKSQIEAEMKSGKVTFCFAKATDGKTYLDREFHNYMKMCDKYGVVKGAYHFAQPTKNTAVQDADNFLKAIEPYVGNILIALDWEGDAIKARGGAQWTHDWLDYVYEKTGVKPLIYCSESTCPMFINTTGGDDLYKSDYGLWVANWSRKPTKEGIRPWGFWAFHQYTNKPFDHDEFHGDMDALKKYMKVKGSSDEQKTGCGCCDKCKCNSGK